MTGAKCAQRRLRLGLERDVSLCCDRPYQTSSLLHGRWGTVQVRRRLWMEKVRPRCYANLAASSPARSVCGSWWPIWANDYEREERHKCSIVNTPTTFSSRQG